MQKLTSQNSVNSVGSISTSSTNAQNVVPRRSKKLLKSRTQTSSIEEAIEPKIEPVTPIFALNANDSTTFIFVNELTTKLTNNHKLVKDMCLTAIGVLVTIYSIYCIEMKLKQLLSSKIFMFSQVLLLILARVFHKQLRWAYNTFQTYRNQQPIQQLQQPLSQSHQQIQLNVNSNINSRIIRFIQFIKKREIYVNIVITVSIVALFYIFYSQMLSFNSLNKKLALIKQQKQQQEQQLDVVQTKLQNSNSQDFVESSKILNQSLISYNLSTIIEVLNESEYKNNQEFYENLLNKLKSIRNRLNKHQKVKIITSTKSIDFINRISKAVAFDDIIKFRKNPKIVKSRNNVKLFRKIETTWFTIFKIALIVYLMLLNAYFVINLVLDHIKKKYKIDAKRSNFTQPTFYISPRDKQFNNTKSTVKTEALIDKKELENEQEKLKTSSSCSNFFKKNGLASLKKSNSLISVKSEHAKSMKLLQKLQKKYQLKFNDDEYDETIGQDEKLFDYTHDLNVLIKQSINNMLNTEAGGFKNEEEFLFVNVETLPAQLTNIRNEINTADNLTFKANIEFPSIDLTLQYKNLATTQKKRLDLKLLNLTGQITITLNQNKLKDNFNLDFSFDKTIEIKYKLDKEPPTTLNAATFKELENLIKSAIQQATLSLELKVTNKQINNIINTLNTQYSPTYSSQKSKDNYESSSINVLKTHQQNLDSINTLKEKRLLVKILKATNLLNCEEPFCVLELDSPLQRHITNVFKDTSSINEQFLFDITNFSEELTFSIYDRKKDYGNDLIGESVLLVSDLCASTQSKRLIQLQKYNNTKAGAITVEFIFLDSVTPININQIKASTFKTNSNDNRPSSTEYLAKRNEILEDNTGNLENIKQLTENTHRIPYSSTTPLKSYESSMVTASATSTHSPGDHSPQHHAYNYNQMPNASNSNYLLQQQNMMINDMNMLDGSNNKNLLINSSSIYNNQHLETEQDHSVLNSSKRVINRNYLHVKPNTNNQIQITTAPIITQSLMTNSNGTLNQVNIDDHDHQNNNLNVKRSRSISRSLRSLFIRSPDSGHKTKNKRDKSMDSHLYGAITHQDVYSESNFKKAKSISGSLKKIFSRKKKDKVNNNSPGAANANETISITVSRQNDINPYLKIQPYDMQVNQTSFYKEDNVFRKEPLMLRKGFRLP